MSKYLISVVFNKFNLMYNNFHNTSIQKFKKNIKLLAKVIIKEIYK